MALTNIDIATRALLKVGSTAIQSFTENSREAEVAGNLYAGIKDALLSEYIWNFAVTDTELARLVTEPTDERWTYQFQQPTDMLRLIRVYDTSGNAIPFYNTGSVILANETRVFLEYLKSVDETDMPAYFVDALVARCAFEFEEPVLGARSVEQSRWQEYLDKRRSAKSADADQNLPNTLVSPANSAVVRARHGGY